MGGRCGGRRLGKSGTVVYSQWKISCIYWVGGLLSCQTNGMFFRLHRANRRATVRQRFARPVRAARDAAKTARSFSPGAILRGVAKSGRHEGDIVYRALWIEGLR